MSLQFGTGKTGMVDIPEGEARSCAPVRLLACPFCGGAPKEYTDGDGPMIGQAVRCTECGAATRVNISVPSDGVSRWQTRWAG